MTDGNQENYWLVKETCQKCGEVKPRIDFAAAMKLTCKTCKNKKERKLTEIEAKYSKRRWVSTGYY